MPRIRKRTSRRGTTAQRTRIKGKVAESRKKAKKAAKKDVTWKSKQPKDPGIPNNFPYKDQILAEIAEERRQALEAKARRKEEKKALRAQQKNAALGANGGEHESEDEENAENNKGGFDGVATFDGRAKAPPSKSKKSAGSAHGTEDGVPPLLMNPELPHLAAVLDKADVVIEILDARDPLAHRSKALEAQVSLKEGRRLLLVLNKIGAYTHPPFPLGRRGLMLLPRIDGCPRESTAAWAAHLRAEHPTLLFRAASSFLPPTVKYDSTKGKGKEKEPSSDDAWGSDAMNTLLGRWAHEKAGDGPLHVAVVGLTNSGKSAFVNSLARRTTLDVYAPSSSTHNSPTTTPHALEVTLELDGKPVVFIDTPGLAWQPSDDAPPEDRVRHRAQDVLLRNKGRIDHLKDPIPAASYIVSRAETEDLMVRYCLPVFAKGDTDAFLMGVARANALVKKGGDPDLVGAARLVLRDWSTGKLPRYAVPSPIAQQADGDSSLATIYADDDSLLERLVPRKELRRSRDVVRLSTGQVDERALALEAPWFGSSATAGSESDEDGEMEASDSGLNDDDDDGDENAESDAQASVRDEDDADGNEDEGTTRSSPARKRKLPPSTKRPVDPARPNKKVAFAATVASVNGGAAKTSSKGRSALRQAPESTRVISAAAASTVTSAEKLTTPDLATGPTSTKKNGSKKSKIGLARAPPAASAAQSTARRTGPIKPAANAPTAVQKRKNQAAAAASEEGAYDFSKFF
ncbi:GNL3L/Grn1 putative GTPase-domain-containing protein [Lactarius sanguifluus]|nr:GNL3L/Grn1 putative GTPase-domain-containing protein [Lactarius sanguifluus]